MTSQSSSRRGSRQVTIEESPLPSKSQPGTGARAGASVAYLEDGLVAGSSPVSDPLLQLPNTYKIVLERDAPPLDSEFEDEEDEYDPSLGVHFYIPPPTSAFDDQSTNDFLSQLTGGGSLLREASTGSNGESAVSANSSMLIIRSISPLSSGKSSPAQRCGMLNKGDVVLRINEETVWGRGVMELGEIISRQMGWKEGGDNSDRMKIELLCVIGEGAEIIKGLEERERRLKNRGGKGRGGGEVDSLLSFLGGEREVRRRVYEILALITDSSVRNVAAANFAAANFATISNAVNTSSFATRFAHHRRRQHARGQQWI